MDTLSIESASLGFELLTIARTFSFPALIFALKFTLHGGTAVLRLVEQSTYRGQSARC